MKRRNFVLASAAGVAAMAAYVALDRGKPTSTPGMMAADTLVDDTIAEISLGDASSPVELIEYGSFTCPACKRFHEEILPGIKRDYIDTGKVRFVYREVFFDRAGLWASMVARCNEDKYFAVADLIYERQAEWTEGSPAEIAENLRKLGAIAGFERDAVESCLQDGDLAQALTARFEEQARLHKVRGTPTLVINGTTHGALRDAELRAALDRAIEAAVRGDEPEA